MLYKKIIALDLSSPDKVKFSSFEELNGWGDQFDGIHLSIFSYINLTDVFYTPQQYRGVFDLTG